MTPAELNIHPKEYKALLKVRNKLCDGSIKPELFDMCDFDSSKSCGTAHCIGGWVRIYYKNINYNKDETFSLFYPREADIPWYKITTCHAVKAIDNFLETGDPNWGDALTNTECPHV